MYFRTWGTLSIPLKAENDLERLRAVEKDYLNYTTKGLNKISKRFIMNLLQILPSKALKYIHGANPGMQTGFTALLGSMNEYSLNGNPVLSIHPIFGTTYENIGKLRNWIHCYFTQ